MAKVRTVCKKIKKKGGGFMFRKVKILASGKWQFAKGTCGKASKKIKSKVKRRKKRKSSKRR
jgi:hypothetical protein